MNLRSIVLTSAVVACATAALPATANVATPTIVAVAKSSPSPKPHRSHKPFVKPSSNSTALPLKAVAPSRPGQH